MQINALNTGLLSRDCNKTCISALTACALEMKRSMYHVIPQVLLNFSKISATKNVAGPMLEFLSTLIRLPDIFSSFTDTNYMSVFAIALPFTNPFKFDAYIVSLAHHIIIMWFLKCRLSYRQNFVQFIVTGLNSNVRQTAAALQQQQQHEATTSSPSFRQRAVTGAVKEGASAAAAAAAQKLMRAGGGLDADPRKRSSSVSDSSGGLRPRSGSKTIAAGRIESRAQYEYSNMRWIRLNIRILGPYSNR